MLQFPQQYAAISEQHQPAELIPQFSTIEYTLMVHGEVFTQLHVWINERLLDMLEMVSPDSSLGIAVVELDALADALKIIVC